MTSLQVLVKKYGGRVNTVTHGRHPPDIENEGLDSANSAVAFHFSTLNSHKNGIMRITLRILKESHPDQAKRFIGYVNGDISTRWLSRIVPRISKDVLIAVVKERYSGRLIYPVKDQISLDNGTTRRILFP